MSIEHSTRTLAALIAESNSGQILLPNFQRAFVWRSDDHRSLAASILLNIPCGSLLMVKGLSSDFASRKVGIAHSEANGPEANCEFWLDGQQRASTIKAIFSDVLQVKPIGQSAGRLVSQLRNRWALRIRPGDDDPDLFGYRALKYSGLPPEPDLSGMLSSLTPYTRQRALETGTTLPFNRSLGRKRETRYCKCRSIRGGGATVGRH